jgi:hypothetical protein
MARPTMKLSAQDRGILFCAATGIDHAAVGITARAMQAVTIRGFIAHNRESGASDVALKMAGRSDPFYQPGFVREIQQAPPKQRWRGAG